MFPSCWYAFRQFSNTCQIIALLFDRLGSVRILGLCLSVTGVNILVRATKCCCFVVTGFFGGRDEA
jgi:hypothetical protein